MIQLSEEQEAVVSAVGVARNVVTVAFPGAGKTRVLLACYEAAVNNGMIVPGEAAMITYTQAAAAELTKRIKAMDLPPPGFVGTLHGFMLKVVRDFGSVINMSSNVAVVDERTAREVLHAQIKIVRFTGSLQQALKAIDQRDEATPKNNALFCAYHEALANQGLIDFSGILFWGLQTLKEIKGRTFFSHLYVDEYQDVSKSDDTIYNTLEMKTRFVIGDPRQAIFGFRGGDFTMLMDLLTHAEWSSYGLTTNYRSSPAICAVANGLAKLLPLPGSRMQPQSTKIPASTVAIERVLNARHQFDAVVDFFSEMDPSDTKAVICRYNWQIQQMAGFLTNAGIPFRTNATRKKPQNWDAVRALVAFLGCPESPALAYSLAVLTLSEKAAKKLKQEAIDAGMSLGRMLWTGAIPEFSDLDQVLMSFNLMGESYGIVVEAAENLSLNEKTWQGLSAALADPGVLDSTKETSGSAILLTTIHGAKGREFGAVACIYWNDELFPGTRKTGHDEEARLAYVAVTRAIHSLMIVSTEEALPFPGATTATWMTPSRFIATIKGAA